MEENNFPGQFYPLECDLIDENDILKSFKWIDENIGAIHFMINNAGIVRINNITGTYQYNYERLKNCKHNFLCFMADIFEKMF